MVASLGKIHQDCMAAMVKEKLVPGGDPGMVGGGMEEFRKREAFLVDRLLLERTGIDSANNAVTDLANFLRGAGIEVTDEKVREVHEKAIKLLLDPQPQQPGQPEQQDIAKQGLKAAALSGGQTPTPVQGKHSQGVVVNRQQNVVQIRIGGL